jgi:hypothetical protein
MDPVTYIAASDLSEAVEAGNEGYLPYCGATELVPAMRMVGAPYKRSKVSRPRTNCPRCREPCWKLEACSVATAPLVSS